MGIAQDMNFIIDLIEKFKSNNQQLVFLFIGLGNEVKNLKHKAEIKNQKTLSFLMKYSIKCYEFVKKMHCWFNFA